MRELSGFGCLASAGDTFHSERDSFAVYIVCLQYEKAFFLNSRDSKVYDICDTLLFIQQQHIAVYIL